MDKISWLCFVPKTHHCDDAQHTVIGPQHLAEDPRPSSPQQGLGKSLPRGWCNPRHPRGTQGSYQDLKIIPAIQAKITSPSSHPSPRSYGLHNMTSKSTSFVALLSVVFPEALHGFGRTSPLLKHGHLSRRAVNRGALQALRSIFSFLN